MGKTKTITEKQKQRAELNLVLDYNEQQLIAMQKKGWKELTEAEVNVLENFLATSMETLRICPPAYVSVASNNVSMRAKARGELVEKVNLVTLPSGEVVRVDLEDIQEVGPGMPDTELEDVKP